METPYVQTFGSFIRNGKYPLEADYIFSSEEKLRQWEDNNRKYLHEGLFKVVASDDVQTLYWYYNDTFQPLLTSESLENIAYLLKDFELHGQLRDLLRDIQNQYESKWKAFQQELDQTQSGAGLNADGSFDTLNVKNTSYLDGANSILECLKALDREMTNLVVDAFIQDAYYDTSSEEIVITFLTKQEKVKTIRINVANLIREWEPDNTHPSKVVQIERQEVHGGGADKISADVRLSSNQDNILEKEGNSLLVRGTSDNISHKGESLEKVVDSLQKPEPKIFSSYQEAVDANLKVGETFLLSNTEEVALDTLPEVPATGPLLWVEDHTWWNSLYLYMYNDSGQWITSPWPGDQQSGKVIINDTTYRYFDLGNCSLDQALSTIFNNGSGSQFDGPKLQDINTDIYLKLTNTDFTQVPSFKTVSYYKGLYVVTEDGFKAVSLDEELKENLEGLIKRVDQEVIDRQALENKVTAQLKFGGYIRIGSLNTLGTTTQPGHFYTVTNNDESVVLGQVQAYQNCWFASGRLGFSNSGIPESYDNKFKVWYFYVTADTPSGNVLRKLIYSSESEPPYKFRILRLTDTSPDPSAKRLYDELQHIEEPVQIGIYVYTVNATHWYLTGIGYWSYTDKWIHFFNASSGELQRVKIRDDGYADWETVGSVIKSKSDIGLSNVTNDAQVKRSEMGTANGVATLDADGKIPADQLPSFVDDIVDVYATYTVSGTGILSNITLYSDAAKTHRVIGETGKIYQNITTGEPNYQFRWNGTLFSQTGPSSLIIGEIAETAFDGARGKAVETDLQNHKSNKNNPHEVTKAQVGLGNVDNTSDTNKPVSTAQAAAIADAKKAGSDAQKAVEAEATARTTAISNAINALDASVTSTDGTNIQVGITEENGKITSVNITTDNTAKAIDLTNEITRASEIEAEHGRKIDDLAIKVDANTLNLSDLDNRKANFYDLSNVMGEEVLSKPVLEDIDILTREQIKKDLFIDQWNIACDKYGRYNKDTGYFELNEITNISYEEALTIMQYYNPTDGSYALDRWYDGCYYFVKVRTFIPRASQSLHRLKSTSTFDSCENLTNVRLWRQAGGYVSVWTDNVNRIFDRCPNITKWLDVVRWFNKPNNITFYFDGYKWKRDNHPFKYFRFMDTNFNINCECYENIGIDSFQYLVRNRYPTSKSDSGPFTVTVHPKVYAKLTGDTSQEHVAAMTPEELSEWTSLLAEAADQKISFATI